MSEPIQHSAFEQVKKHIQVVFGDREFKIVDQNCDKSGRRAEIFLVYGPDKYGVLEYVRVGASLDITTDPNAWSYHIHKLGFTSDTINIPEPFKYKPR